MQHKIYNETKMEDLKLQQIEALTVASEYFTKLIPATENLIQELTTKRLSDTENYLNQVLNGINWTIQIYNGTKELVDAHSDKIDKDSMNSSVNALNEAIKQGDDLKLSEYLQVFLGFLNALNEVAAKVKTQ